VNTQAPAADFSATDASVKRTLVEKLAKSWSLAPADPSKQAIVNEEQVAVAEVRLSPCQVCPIYCYLPLAEHIGYFPGLCSSVKNGEFETVCFCTGEMNP